ncbi:hypothetical protein [Wenzhouxiangella marina]|uniref:Uncharacterized protein n=1 Tax=Wenzhouxiangella marina TaxID=1579979 RepID=A0A0K0XWC2_9GAMM|nr:hypothetical protein [Wenzhouxiangella marina]AKS41978.1 hypothetical protein WM2015_1608 [Wenzhouxiangella marina]MBB6086255.1 hypothetical protein [Wenzhouxiangella marina]
MINKLLLAVALCGPMLSSGLKAEDHRHFSPEPGQGLTIYHDVNPLTRTHRAAAAMTELHAEYYERGYTVIDVEPYVEDGDLKGFFITYVARDNDQP